MQHPGTLRFSGYVSRVFFVMATPGYVYVLSNPAMPGLVKIGRSIRSGAIRRQALYQTGVPDPFVLEFEIYAPNHDVLEAVVHERLDARRNNPGREFFRCEVAEAFEAILATYLSECLGTGATLVDDYAYNASVDLQWLSARYNIHWIDIYECVTHLSEFAVRKAVDELVAARERRREQLTSKPEHDQAS